MKRDANQVSGIDSLRPYGVVPRKRSNLSPRRDDEPRIRSSILVIPLVTVLITLGTGRNLPAKSGCSKPSLKGSYGLHATGIDEPGDVPFAAVGVFTFDGAGNLAGDVFFNARKYRPCLSRRHL